MDAHLHHAAHPAPAARRPGVRARIGAGRPRPDAPRRNLVLAAMCLALATVVSAVSSLNVALPDIARELHATETQLQWIVDAYAVFFAGLLLLGGALGDSLGRKHVLLVGLLVFAVAATQGAA
jgi:MFS family permease